ncbi:hypothetical protein [Flavobacterium sp. HNIBRBA15423]|uniref:hypothetical protein n=1 Tax=Flavobacterium sp. HNIBRBA15423 TaxID=3458683 RepID=UPI004043DB42
MEIDINLLTKSNEFELIKPRLPETIEAKKIYQFFKIQYFRDHQVPFIENIEAKQLVYTLIYYFQNKDNFFNSNLLYPIIGTNFSLQKGLIIIGGYGTGKSTILKTFQNLINSVFKSQITLKFNAVIDVVQEFETTIQENISAFNEKYNNGYRIFDDLKSEKEASRFGKKDIFKEILFKRCENKKIASIITANYQEENPNNMELAIEEFYRYEGRVYDRIIGSFNFIQLQDKSYRK